jgi:hypothetical protein
MTGDIDSGEASFSFGDDRSEAFLNFEIGRGDIGSRASLSFGITIWLNGNISWFCGDVGPSKTISHRFHNIN